MPSRRAVLAWTATAGAGSLAGCPSGLPDGRERDPTTTECAEPTDASAGEYDFSRAGMVQATPAPDDADASPEIPFSECLYGWIQIVVERAVETGDLESHELSADQRAAARRNLEANFGVSTPRFFVDYQQTLVEVRLVVFNTA
jgi:hypothetical protein